MMPESHRRRKPLPRGPIAVDGKWLVLMTRRAAVQWCDPVVAWQSHCLPLNERLPLYVHPMAAQGSSTALLVQLRLSAAFYSAGDVVSGELNTLRPQHPDNYWGVDTGCRRPTGYVRQRKLRDEMVENIGMQVAYH